MSTNTLAARLCLVLVSVSCATARASPGAEQTSPADEQIRLAGLRVENISVSPSDEIGEGASFSMKTGGGKRGLDSTDASGEWVIAPVPGSSPVFGATLAVGAAKIYHPRLAGKEAPPWTTGGGVFAAENKSWGAALGHKMNLGNDAWRITALATCADLIYRYYGVGAGAGDEEHSIDLDHRVVGGGISVLRRIRPEWYLGAAFTAGDSRIERADPLDRSQIPLPPGWPPMQPSFAMLLVSLVPMVQHDSRDNEFYPTQGILLESKVSFASEALGSDFDFQTYQLNYNQYFSWRAGDVIAVRVHARLAEGDVPFFALSSLGQGSDLRGYTPGRYRDNALLTAQAEYRRSLSERWVAVVFAGVGGVGPSISDLGTAMPAAGVGLRFVLAKQNHVSLRLDAAWGRDDSGFYLGVGEAF